MVVGWELLTGEVSKRFDNVSEVLNVISVVAKSTEELPEFLFSLRARHLVKALQPVGVRSATC